MSAQSPDLSITADTVPGRCDALTASPSPAVPATDSPAGGRLPLSATERTRHRRFRHLGRVDRDSLYAVLGAGLVAHLGVITGGWPMVVPTVYGYDPDTLYLHGSVASQSLNTAGTPVCVTITLTDALVLARSVFEHTINYRSAMIYGRPPAGHRPRRTARRDAHHHRARGTRPVGLRPPAQPQGTRGGPPAGAVAGRGLGEDPHRPARRRRQPRCCAGFVGGRTTAGHHLAATHPRSGPPARHPSPCPHQLPRRYPDGPEYQQQARIANGQTE
jgi:nitroimidazol reductase NimA-like FMN-containing flavoprotein (pyridoxamine 5'-phosphate oxidase superfamily)